MNCHAIVDIKGRHLRFTHAQVDQLRIIIRVFLRDTVQKTGNSDVLILTASRPCAIP